MSRITFIENRGKTAFWAAVARRLQNSGHSVSWIVQNPAYAPRLRAQEVICLPLPELSDLCNSDIPEAFLNDRGATYFGAGRLHFAHYRAQIDSTLGRLCPDAVIGEPTLFHELLTIDLCRSRSIPYLHPTMTRYPAGRFVIFDGDTQMPAATSGEQWTTERLRPLAQAISTGRSLPSYMTEPTLLRRSIQHVRRLGARSRTTYGWLAGERFNTPSPSRKLRLQRALKKNLQTWNRLARIPEASMGATILYPLQMQPEANIDVWGRPFSDQVALIRRLLAASPPEGRIAVKANPKSKYEISAALIALASDEPRVILLPLDYKMEDAHALASGAVTVSGTVGLEAVFGRGRCLSLRHPILEQSFPSFHADTPELAVARILNESEAGVGSIQTGMALLRKLIAMSFEGSINEPLYDPGCMADDNVANVAAAIDKAVCASHQRVAA